jgi:hypothetical protein
MQRKCACGGTPGPTGECETCRKKREPTALQRAADHRSSFNARRSGVPQIVHEVLHSPGQPLDASTRAFMEPRFGHDFSHVRIHTDEKAAESARSVNAQAYTVGRNIVFGTQQCAPSSFAGRQLMAHELTHVIQQENSSGPLGDLRVGAVADRYESEAERWSHAVTTSARPIPNSIAPARAAIQRKCNPRTRQWETDYSGCSFHWTLMVTFGVRDPNNPAVGLRKPANPSGEGTDTRFATESRDGPCDKHDACYQKCWPSESKEAAKKACDDQFYQDMLDVCASADKKALTRCKDAARVYHFGVKKWGAGPFRRNQQRSCDCKTLVPVGDLESKAKGIELGLPPRTR